MVRTWIQNLEFKEGTKPVKFKGCTAKRMNDRRRNTGFYEDQYLGGMIAFMKESQDQASKELVYRLIAEQSKRYKEYGGDYDVEMILDYVDAIDGIPATKESIESLDVHDYNMLIDKVRNIELGLDNKLIVFRQELVKLLTINPIPEETLKKVDELFTEMIDGTLEKKTLNRG